MKTLLMTTIMALSTASFARESRDFSFVAERMAERRAEQVQTQKSAAPLLIDTEKVDTSESETALSECYKSKESKNCC